MFPRILLNYLLQWQKRSDRKPLILRGARQVGKTSLLKFFGKKYFTNLVYINLENVDHARLFRKEMSLSEFEQVIKIVFNQEIIDGKTLIFIDELQNSPSLVRLLRFFYEKRPKLHVVAAGSLLEAKIIKEGFSLPVGRVEFAYLYPLNFFEFLQAKKEVALADYLQNHDLTKPVLEPLHQKSLDLFREYAMIGGMPGIVAEYVKGRGIAHLKRIYSQIYSTYLDDLNKYASLEKVKYLQFVLEKAPLYAGRLISLQNFAGSTFKYREMAEAFAILEKVQLLKLLPATNSKQLPILAKQKRPKKLLFLDVGFVNYLADTFDQFLNKCEDGYVGRVFEQLIGQNILASYQFDKPRIYYWAKEKRRGSAELDFALVKNGSIWGIEVKAGQKRNLKSLAIFSKEVSDSKAVRFCKENISRAKNHWVYPYYLTTRVLASE